MAVLILFFVAYVAVEVFEKYTKEYAKEVRRKSKKSSKIFIEEQPLMNGVSVTRRIKQVHQPYGGYLRGRDLEKIKLGDGIEALNVEENIRANLVGLSVDYLSRYMTGTSVEKAFQVSLNGATMIGKRNVANGLISKIKNLDDTSIISAVKLVGFDTVFRAGESTYKPIEDINPNQATIENIRTMVMRSQHFFEVYGPKVMDGFNVIGGYTDTVSTGDGDFITRDTLWDFKVSKRPVNKDSTLQILMYWRMGLHSIHPEFKKIKYLGIYNPRMNEVSRIAVADIPKEVIEIVEKEVIGY